MSKLPQVSHERIVRALKRAGFYILREGKHISMTDDKHLVIIPRHHTIKPGTHSDTSSTPQTSLLSSSRICFSVHQDHNALMSDPTCTLLAMLSSHPGHPA